MSRISNDDNRFLFTGQTDLEVSQDDECRWFHKVICALLLILLSSMSFHTQKQWITF